MSSRPEPLSATTNYASVRCLDRGLLFSAGITIYVFLVIFFDVDSEFGFNVFFFFFSGSASPIPEPQVSQCLWHVGIQLWAALNI